MGTRAVEFRVYDDNGAPYVAATAPTTKVRYWGDSTTTPTPTHIADGVWATTVDDEKDSTVYWSGTGILADHLSILRIPKDVLGSKTVQDTIAAEVVNLNGWDPATAYVLADVRRVNGGATDGYNATLKLKMLDVSNNAGHGIRSIGAGTASNGIFATGTNGTGIKATGTYGLALEGSALDLVLGTLAGVTAAKHNLFDVLSSSLTFAGSLGKTMVDGWTAILARIPSVLTITGGKVTVGTNDDKTGYTLAGAYDAAKDAASKADLDAAVALLAEGGVPAEWVSVTHETIGTDGQPLGLVPPNARIVAYLAGEAKHEDRANETGQYSIELPPDNVWVLKAFATGYLTTSAGVTT